MESEWNVLMVDDDDVLCAMVTEFLALEGFAVTSANDGASGLEKRSMVAIRWCCST